MLVRYGRVALESVAIPSHGIVRPRRPVFVSNNFLQAEEFFSSSSDVSFTEYSRPIVGRDIYARLLFFGHLV